MYYLLYAVILVNLYLYNIFIIYKNIYRILFLSEIVGTENWWMCDPHNIQNQKLKALTRKVMGGIVKPNIQCVKCTILLKLVI